LFRVLFVILLFLGAIHAAKVAPLPKENLLTLGIQLAQGTSTETLSNKTGSKDYSYDLSSVKILIGQDRDFYNMGMQTSRLQLSYKYSELDADLSFATFSVGYQENMRYWSLFRHGNHSIYPYASVELGYNALKKADISSKGKSVEVDVGMAYAYRDVAFTLAVASTYIEWNHPEDGINDYMQNYQLVIGMTYRFMDTGR